MKFTFGPVTTPHPYPVVPENGTLRAVRTLGGFETRYEVHDRDTDIVTTLTHDEFYNLYIRALRRNDPTAPDELSWDVPDELLPEGFRRMYGKA